jgi:hypothetical protein
MATYLNLPCVAAIFKSGLGILIASGYETAFKSSMPLAHARAFNGATVRFPCAELRSSGPGTRCFGGSLVVVEVDSGEGRPGLEVCGSIIELPETNGAATMLS